MSFPDADLPFFELAANTRAMRMLKPDPVPMDTIWKVLNTGVQAPSGQNTQPWKFLVVSDPERKKWFAERYAQAFEKRAGLHADASASRSWEADHAFTVLFRSLPHLPFGYDISSRGSRSLACDSAPGRAACQSGPAGLRPCCDAGVAVEIRRVRM